MLTMLWRYTRQTATAFIEDEALTRGAAIAFYAATSVAPLLFIVIGMAGLVFGQEAAQRAITTELSELMGQSTAQMLEAAVANASGTFAGVTAILIGVVTLLVTASGAFGEIQSALNVIWKAAPQDTTLSRLLRARAISMGLVATLGFLLVVSLAVSAGITALGTRLNDALPFGQTLASVLNAAVSFSLIAILFAAVYKVLPDRSLQWRDVLVGSVLTALLFVGGKSLIGWYIGSSGISSVYGAAGSLMILLLWVFYSVQIFLLGAELTKTFANLDGSKQAAPVT